MKTLSKLATSAGLAAGLSIAAAFTAAAPANAQACAGRDCPVIDPVVTPGPSCSGSACTGSHTTNNNTSTSNNSTRVGVLVAPNMAVSNGWCMESLSGVIGGGSGTIMATLGLSKSSFAEACGRWYTLAQGASNNNCVPAMTSVLIAAGEQVGPALQQSVSACYGPARAVRAGAGNPRPRN